MLKKCIPLIAAFAVTISPVAMSGHHEAKYPKTKPNQFWWPNQVDLSPLRDHDASSNPYGADFDYAAEFSKLDFAALKKDIDAALTDSQDWWPADWGHYGGLFIRMTWHAAGTYRTLDGRGGAGGGQQRFEPLGSWPDNGNLDKARRLLWPVKQKYGRQISWGDLIVLTGNVALENMGFQTYGFAGGRADDWEPDQVYWGPEVEMLASDRENTEGRLVSPLGATHMGLIYVNPAGPKGVPDLMGSARNIRVTFGRMAMNDEETVALVAGGHTFGKMHGAHEESCNGPDPAAAPLEQQGLGWKNKCGKGHSEDTVTSGFEGAWTQAPTRWTSLYLANLLNFEWVQSKAPSGNIIWVPAEGTQGADVADAHVAGKTNKVVMTTADVALKTDPAYRKIVERFLADPEAYRLAFAKAWFKLTHRDMGPKALYLGSEVPDDELMWQDPVPKVSYKLVSDKNVKSLKKQILDSGLSVQELVGAAWASASSYRGSDMRGGSNGGRLRLAPMKDWAANDPQQLAKVLGELEKIQAAFNKKSKRKQVSMADLIVLGGAAAIEKAAKDAGFKKVSVPFTPGRGDATPEQTDIASVSVLEPTADAFRNYFNSAAAYRPETDMLVDKADQLGLTVPEMTALIGGMRTLGVTSGGSKHGVLTDNTNTLTNDYFVNLLDNNTTWKKDGDHFSGTSGSGNTWTATAVDLVFGAHSELRAVAEVYGSNDAKQHFVDDFVSAWAKVMNLGRF